MDKLISLIKTYIEEEAEFLNSVSQDIWKTPELAFNENHAHELLTNILEEKGFDVQRHYLLPTAFRAEYSSSNPGPTIALICEYDALPKIGHACGHNLIAEAGLGAGLALKNALIKDSSLFGKVVVLGTPAEEGGGGKVTLINGGAFKDIDIALMVHPTPNDHLYPPFIAINRVTVTYTGKEAHASGFPWEGKNALDAAVACYNNVSLLRQHIKPTCRVHGVITHGGIIPNVIPAYSELKFYFRAPSTKELENLRTKLEACFRSAALATGCEVSIDFSDYNYEGLITNKVLAELYKKYASEMGIKFEDGNPKILPFTASTDMGNVSHVVPSIHPTYSIESSAPNHSIAFAEAAGASSAQRPTLIAAQAMALLSLEIMRNPQLLNEAKQQFGRDLEEDAIGK